MACIEGGVQVAVALTSKCVDGITFTGSTEKGKLVAAAAAKNLVPCILELGGKSPCIVDETADIDFAAKKLCFGRFANFGQTCVAPDYVYVHTKVKDLLIEKLAKYVKEMYDNGNKVDEYGHAINDFHHERLCALMKSHGGEVKVGNPNAATDKKLEPTVILNPSKTSEVMISEIFGPILPIFTYEDPAQIIKEIKSRDKPLVIYYFGKTFYNKTMEKIKNETSSGAFSVNEVLFHLANPYLPFGGVGGSGYGRCHGKEGFQQCSNSKSVLIKPTVTMYPYSEIYPPFTNKKQNLLKTLTKYVTGTQCQSVKRLIYLLIGLFAVVQVARGKINKQTFVKLGEVIKTIYEVVMLLVKKE